MDIKINKENHEYKVTVISDNGTQNHFSDTNIYEVLLKISNDVCNEYSKTC